MKSLNFLLIFNFLLLGTALLCFVLFLFFGENILAIISTILSIIAAVLEMIRSKISSEFFRQELSHRPKVWTGTQEEFNKLRDTGAIDPEIMYCTFEKD